MVCKRNQSKAILFLLFFFFYKIYCFAPYESADLIVKTNEGPVQGHFDIPNGGSIVFRGVPYAKNPPGRFVPPEPAEDRGTTVYDALNFASPCLQKDFSQNGDIVGSEDCLYLNIWIPGAANSHIFKSTVIYKKPVVIAFHDGFQGFGSGNDSSIIGNIFADGGNAIWVSVNYRLGIWGFLAHPGLSIQQGGFSGAYGTLDQILAVKWVKANIRRFGGDPDKITLYGIGGGATAVTSLISYDKLKGCAKAALIESPYVLWQQTLSHVESTYQTLINQNLNCTGFQNPVDCIKGVSDVALCDAVYPAYNMGDPFSPENFPNHIFMAPAGSITTKSILQTLKTCPPDTDITLLVGNSLNESKWYSDVVFPRSPTLAGPIVRPLILEFLKRLFPAEIGNVAGLNTAVNFVIAQYSSNWDEIVSDAQFVCSTYALLNCTKLSGFDQLYHYVISSGSTLTFETNHHGAGNPYWTKQYYHNKFGNDTHPVQRDYLISHQMDKWFNAVLKNVDPNNGQSLGPVPLSGWPKWDCIDQRYADIRDFPIPWKTLPTAFQRCEDIWFKAFV
jgi:carboxylesterase type B